MFRPRFAFVLSLLLLTASPCLSAQAIRQDEGQPLSPPNLISTSDGTGTSFPVGFNLASLPLLPFYATIEAEHLIINASGQSTLQRRIQKIARDSQGRTRIDADLNVAGGPVDMKLVTVEIYDPVAKCEITLFPQNHSAIRVQYKIYPARPPKYPILTEPDDLGFGFARPPQPTPDTRREELGAEVTDGMPLRHGRETSHYPAGYAGQKEAHTVVIEYWYSQELQSPVFVKQLGPHSVDTLSLRNIRRENPDPSLFKIPQGYKVKEEIRKEFKPA